MPLSLGTRKADEFAALLESGKTSGDPALAHLTGLVQRLGDIPQPTAAFRSSLRDQLVSTAAHTLPAPRPPTDGGLSSGTSPGSTAPGSTGSAASGTAGAATGGASGTSLVSGALAKSAPLWLKGATALLAAGVATTGVGMGAHQALPGDLFYSLKRHVESLQLDMAGGAQDKAVERLGFAQARLSEISALLKRDNASGGPLSPQLQSDVESLLRAWASQASAGTTVLLDRLRATGGTDSDIRGHLQEFLQKQAPQVAALLNRLPAGDPKTLAADAFVYLEKVDTALGSPVKVAQLLPASVSIPGQQPQGSPSAGSPTSPVGAGSTTPGTSPSGSGSSGGSLPGGTVPGTGGTTPGSESVNGTTTGGGTSNPSGSTQSGTSGGTSPKLPLPSMPKLPSGSGGGGNLPLPLPSSGTTNPLPLPITVPSVPSLPLPSLPKLP